MTQQERNAAFFEAVQNNDVRKVAEYIALNSVDINIINPKEFQGH